MKLRLPKPLHGWRQFAGEVGVIVLGVLLALGAQQAVETLDWRNRTRQAVDSLKDEVGGAYFAAAEVVIAGPCVDRQLQALEQALLKPGPYVPARLHSGRAYQFVYRAPFRVWSDNIWKSVVAEGITSHLDRELRLQLGAHYDQAASMREVANDARQMMWKLRVLAKPIEPDAATRARLLEELEHARGLYSVMALSGDQIIGRVDKMRPGFVPASLDKDLRESATLNYCREHRLPLGQIAPQR